MTKTIAGTCPSNSILLLLPHLLADKYQLTNIIAFTQFPTTFLHKI